MKRVIINESQYNRLLEAVTREDFSLAIMDSMTISAMRYGYCSSRLGEPIGEGSSRAVFLLSDEHVLKLAYRSSSNSGAEQNKVEWMECKNNSNSILFPRVYQHADDFSWMIAEHVVNATILDFHKVLGMPFEYGDEGERIKDNQDKIPIEDNGKYRVPTYDSEARRQELRSWALDDYRDYEKYGNPLQMDESVPSFLDFANWADSKIKFGKEYPNDRFFNSLLTNNPNSQWFQAVYTYIESNNGVMDFDIDNFGLAVRNGKPTIVLLDSGFNAEIQQKYY